MTLPASSRNPGPQPLEPQQPAARPPDHARVPGHVAVIMDGNGRWAARRGLPRSSGHEAGLTSFVGVVDGALEAGVRHLSIFAFSTENWRREPAEVAYVLEAIRTLLDKNLAAWLAGGVRLRWAGRRDRVEREAGALAEALCEAEKATAENGTLELTVCVDYGSRTEIAQAAARLCERCVRQGLAPEHIDEAVIDQELHGFSGIAEVDLLIRTSGEQRLSNFLLWQSAYAELYFTDVLWPDFDGRELRKALTAYAARDRRFGAAQASGSIA
jgi:undecaprenyl diphosphate synthase